MFLRALTMDACFFVSLFFLILLILDLVTFMIFIFASAPDIYFTVVAFIAAGSFLASFVCFTLGIITIDSYMTCENMKRDCRRGVKKMFFCCCDPDEENY